MACTTFITKNCILQFEFPCFRDERIILLDFGIVYNGIVNVYNEKREKIFEYFREH